MMQIDHRIFFDEYRAVFGPLKQCQVDGLKFLLSSMEADTDLDDYRHVAYMLATVKHETGGAYQPVEEIGKGKGRSYGKPIDGRTYYGRGYVQLTWQRNYRAMGELFHIPLMEQPELALDPEWAYKIMSYGMKKGFFTGKYLSYYINSKGCDYLSARKIINGMDRAQLVAGYAQKFQMILGKALY